MSLGNLVLWVFKDVQTVLVKVPVVPCAPVLERHVINTVSVCLPATLSAVEAVLALSKVSSF